MVGADRLDLFQYGDQARIMDADELLASVPEVTEVADVVPVPFQTIQSSSVDAAGWLALNNAVHATVLADPEIEGIVIAHGTSTLEETAYFLNLVVKVGQPIVVVGAMRPPTGLSSDAHLNLLNAVRVAAEPVCRGLGVLVVMNDQIQASRDVTKGSAFRIEAFRSPELGALGYVDPDGSVSIYRMPSRSHAPETEFDVRGLGELPDVGITFSYAGAGRTPIDAFVEQGVRGLVCAGMGPGSVTPAEASALREARRRGVAVVIASRTGSGRVLRQDAHRRDGFVTADNLNPQKARVLTMLALTRTDDPELVQEMFDRY